ncbi:MAG: mannose-1-phosphate guanylyltransferase [Epulopiscium sp.]|nr:mannose-1-phosphate guanylyltransferase [Candidatus Epulonipiscium sp.]
MLCALIMAGGKGTRFWPLSTEEKPKQFLNLIGNDTMIQMTVKRILPIIPIDRIFVCTGERYVNLVKEQLPALPERNIIVEPEGRNTAPCIALSTFVIERYYKNSTIAVLPSDHLIKDEEEFRNALLLANNFIENKGNSILTLGMKPDRPETGYGYIKVSKDEENKIKKVERFVEKPNLETAENYLKEGCYLWNGGMFVWKGNTILNEIKKYVPNTYEALHNIAFIDEEKLQDLINLQYKQTDSISIDYAVLEKSDKIYVIPSNFGWDDIGSWRAVERYREKDCNNNILNDGAKVIECQSSMVLNNKKKIVMIGIEDVMSIETEDAIFVVNKKYMDTLKEYKEYI